MINEEQFTITFTYKGKVETRVIYRMKVSYLPIQDFYRIPGKERNYDIYKLDGVWFSVLKNGLRDELVKLVGNAIDEAEK